MRGSVMAGVPVLNRYALYKAGTVELLRWLLATSAACGYGDPKNPPKSPVPVSRLLRCAQTTCTKQPAVHIPGSIIELTVNVIHGRELYAELYASAGDEVESHLHFIDVLGQVFTLLKDARKRYQGEHAKPSGKRTVSGESSTSIESATSTDHHNTANTFKYLSVDEPSSKPFSTPEKRGSNRKAPTPSILATLPEEERKMALVCYLEDMIELRKYIKDLWDAYAAGDLSLDCAGTTTELAFGAMRRAEEDLTCTFQALGGGDIMALFRILTATTELFGAERDDSSELRNKLLCPFSMILAQTAIDACEAGCDPYNHHKYNPCKITEGLCRIKPFGEALLSIVPDFITTPSRLDEFSSAFFPHNGYYKVRISTVMMVESYIEIYDIIGDPALLVPQALETAYNRSMRMIDRCFHVRDRVRNPFPFANLWRHEQKVAETGTFLEALRATDTTLTTSTVNSQARIFKVLPVAAIERIKYLKWGMNMTASVVANDGWNIIAMSYLYRASHHYGIMTEQWRDLDWLINHQSKKRPYLIEVPEHADEDAFSRYHQMAWGIPKNTADKKAMGKVMLNMRRMEPLLDYPARMEKESQSQDNLGHERGEMAEVVMRKMASEKFFGKGYKNVKKQEGKRFTNIELLETYKESFIADELEYNMDLLGFWSDVAELMQTMHKFLYPRLMTEELDPASILDTHIVRPLLDEAAFYKKNNMSMNKPQIALAAKMVEKHVRSRGSRYIEEAKGMSSGNVVPENKPKIVLWKSKVRDAEAESDEAGNGHKDNGSTASAIEVLQEAESFKA